VDLSIVTSLYRSERHLDEFVRRMSAAAAGLGVDYEIVLVDDASPDGSLAAALALFAAERRLRVVELDGNYGQHPAILAGVRESRGDLVFLIDSDLEEPPELLEDFWRERARLGAPDLLLGIQGERTGSAFSRLTAATFYRLLDFLAPVPVPANAAMVRLMSRSFAAAMLAQRRPPASFDLRTALVGGRRATLTVRKEPRAGSSYTLGKKVRLALRSLLDLRGLSAPMPPAVVRRVHEHPAAERAPAVAILPESA
jgi:putative glycosyltransferase